MNGRIGNDSPNRKVSARFIALMTGDVQAARAIIEMCDPKAFPAGIGIGEAPREEVAGGRQAIELERKLGRLVAHARRVPAR